MHRQSIRRGGGLLAGRFSGARADFATENQNETVQQERNPHRRLLKLFSISVVRVGARFSVVTPIFGRLGGPTFSP